MKIDSCIIIKNEEKNIENLINQLLVFSNEIHITDTGSTDSTIKIIENFQSHYNNVFLHYFEWCMDFSKARNYSFSCYECKSDYQFWCDGDDELNDKLIETLKKFSQSIDYKDDIYFINYQYSESFILDRTSLIKVSSNLKWNDPIHEFIDYDDNNTLNYSLFNNGSLIIHHQHLNDHSLRNIEIFRNMEASNYKFSSRNRFYYGKELYEHNFNEYAIYQFCKCIDEDDNNILDKINACCYLFFINENIGLEYFYKLFKTEIIRKDLLYYVGNVYYNRSNYILAKYFYLLCINTNEPSDYLKFNYNSIAHKNSLFQLNLIEFNQFNNIDKSLYYNEEILKIDPNNEIAISNIKILKDIKNNK